MNKHNVFLMKHFFNLQNKKNFPKLYQNVCPHVSDLYIPFTL